VLLQRACLPLTWLQPGGLALHRPGGLRRGWRSSTALAAAEGTIREEKGSWPALYKWAEDTGMDMTDIAIEVAPVDLAPGELGLLAKAPIAAGDVLAWAPSSLLLTKGKAVAAFGDAVSELPDRIALALLLIHEQYVKDTSLWSIYLSMLPSFAGDVSGPSFLWTEEEWEWLEGSDCRGASEAMRTTVLNEYEALAPQVTEALAEAFPPRVLTVERYLWAQAVVASRAYGDDEEGQNLAIAPLVDFLNHRAGALQLTRFSNGIVAHAHQSYSAGDQVFVSYGGKNNAQLLSQYGFIDEGNQNEAVYLRMGSHLKLAAPQLEAKRRLLEELLGDYRDPGDAILRVAIKPREWQAELIPVARILALSDEDTMPESVRDLRAPQPSRHEAAAWDLLAEAMELRSEEYPTPLEETKRLIEGELSERQLLAVRLRQSEQELLQLARSYVIGQRDIALENPAELD